MELALVQHSIYIPPMLVGCLFYFYRGVLFTAENHPFTKPFVAFVTVANTIVPNMSSMMGYTHSKALVVKETSATLLDTMVQTMTLVVHTLQQSLASVLRLVRYVHSTMMYRMYDVVNKTVSVAHSIRYRFTTTVHQTYNFTSFLFASIEEKLYDKTSLIGTMKHFFFPGPKSMLEKVHLGIGIAVALLILGLTWYYLVKSKSTTLQESATVVEPKEEVKEVKKSVRRRAKAV